MFFFVDSSIRGPTARIRRSPKKGDTGDAPSRRRLHAKIVSINKGVGEEVNPKWISSVVVSASIVISNMFLN